MDCCRCHGELKREEFGLDGAVCGPGTGWQRIAATGDVVLCETNNDLDTERRLDGTASACGGTSRPSWCVRWLSEATDRTKERHYRAWQLINSARASIGDGGRKDAGGAAAEGEKEAGWSGDGGRKDALQNLHGDGVSLAGALLEGAHLPELDLQGADLRAADLGGANLWRAKFRGAKLNNANLKGANLRGAMLDEAELFGANLQDANLAEANLRGARLGADLPGNVESAYLRPGWRLKGANLNGANLAGADLRGADLQSAEGITMEQLANTRLSDRTELPPGLDIPENWIEAEEPPGAK